MPVTPEAVLELLAQGGVDLASSHVVVIGRSRIVGAPLAQALLAADATVSVAHYQTPSLEALCRSADVVIPCAGVPGLVKGDWIRPGGAVVNVGEARALLAEAESLLAALSSQTLLISSLSLEQLQLISAGIELSPALRRARADQRLRLAALDGAPVAAATASPARGHGSGKRTASGAPVGTGERCDVLLLSCCFVPRARAARSSTRVAARRTARPCRRARHWPCACRCRGRALATRWLRRRARRRVRRGADADRRARGGGPARARCRRR